MRKVKTFFALFSLSILLTLALSALQVNPLHAATESASWLMAQEQTNNRSFEEIVKNSQKKEGLFTLYHNQETGKVHLELSPEQLQKNYLCFISLESGIGEGGIFRGLDLNEFLFQWRRQNNKVQLVVPNINFRTQPNDPQSRSVNRSVSDSVLYSLPILSTHPERQSILIDLTNVITSDRDLSNLANSFSKFLGSRYSIDSEKSYVYQVKSFPLNIEIESVFGFSENSGSRGRTLSSLPDSRAFNLNVRYSFIEVPTENSYRPRLADERVGFFTSAYKDLSNSTGRSPFVRYINRWNLQKQDPNSPLSPPIKPIVFWIENTVPLEYREAITEGVLMWNEAFEKAGYQDAIQVKQMPDDAPWDPADVRYNTIRWSTSFQPWFNGYGPSHVNPLTGQILDADIVIESNAVAKFYEGVGFLIDNNEGNNSQQNSSSQMNRNPCNLGRLSLAATSAANVNLSHDISSEHLCFGFESNRQLAMGAMAMSLFDGVNENSPKIQDYVHQYLRFLTAHEVGHTLGLRHNFHGSTLLSPEQLNDTNITHNLGLVGSVMDYVPVNLAPKGEPQGDYFPIIIGPYDRWAIEYGYTPTTANTLYAEEQFLKDIAQKSGEPELSFATDEDLWGVFLDPAANVFDLSNNMLQYSEWQLDNAIAMWDRLESRSPRAGEGYYQIRRMFETIFGYYQNHAENIVLYIGGQSFNRNRIGDPNGRLPFEPIPVIQQREALATLQKYVFSEEAFQFSPQLLNKLAPSRWQDWGNPDANSSLEYRIGDRILRLQKSILEEILAPTRLVRLRDLEFKTAPNNSLTMPELFEALQNSIWTEVLQPEEGVEISGIRRSLQREHLNLLTKMVLREVSVPEDALTLAWFQLKQLQEVLDKTLEKHNDGMNAYTLAHLEMTRDRIVKTLGAQLQTN
ncbi:zinc-dependent metalloprotease [Capilliphycus salinus ALCB114379]|uniref:zinc-dependent metalloprotease n=1 Tax=Capilliphycus salinus TaxID=2768948 RepID=UPI0039A49085